MDHRTTRKARPQALFAVAFVVLAMVIGGWLGDSYIARLTNHAGYFLVPVEDHVAAPMVTPRPRHTIVIVVDGLRMDGAESMTSTKRLLEHGQCRVADQGGYTVSRPIYALLSTGLEVDRTGARNNENTAPLAAESIWQVAREAGLTVGGSSHLPWFRELFPSGFTRFEHEKMHTENIFATPELRRDGLLDVNLFHPLYVDEAGHQTGGDSPEYKAAVARADREIGKLLEGVDLTKDLVVLTADHGHRDAGGHGGAQDEINHVLTCFAGPHVVKRDDRRAFDARSTAASLSLMLGLRFPRHMRAGDDALDQIFEWRTDEAADTPYVEDRHAAIAHFRTENAAALAKRSGGELTTWPKVYAHERSKQMIRAFVLVLIGVAFLFARLRHHERRERLVSGLWLSMLLATIWVVHHLVLGDFDYTVINLKVRYLPRAFAVVLLAGAFAWTARLWQERRSPLAWAALANDALTFCALLLLVNLGHIFVYGWPLGFPLPSQPARYFPFFGAIAQVGFGLLTLLAILGASRSARRAERSALGRG